MKCYKLKTTRGNNGLKSKLSETFLFKTKVWTDKHENTLNLILIIIQAHISEPLLGVVTKRSLSQQVSSVTIALGCCVTTQDFRSLFAQRCVAKNWVPCKGDVTRHDF